METTTVRTEFVLNYVVIMNDGVNEHSAEAGFRNKLDAMMYASKRAAEFELLNPIGINSAYDTARVARYEVVHVHGDERDEERDIVYETRSFCNG